ncbi:BirA family transcriptional regulator, biotin operon repressor / biotin-[acetyl-CoA-carboxylase] ligase [Lentzea xinjiangensis]|uniref:biotin--[biotin carboxyl-carrier protein] ligase n=1 Tax=Lentzea xinjiangensis TaxID=402600 RepID=A0A1H9C0Y5_9PSEU|nr:biotin--[acetyl-CoA-carboxylase] ligase [Lentzea xinjiangensis]SEP94910.1 BirA family transcriptional regulator, biotin operon repressor / biotin-[acetyl-CoA-carboxylase] ligase [Lentzea xinjiangensis]
MDTALDADALRARLVALHGPYAALDVVASTQSTNADLAAADGALDRTVLIALEQTAGQGRRGRSWSSPPGGLYASVLFRPSGVPPQQLPWLNLIAGLALVRVAQSTGVEAAVKWPNDLLLGPQARKGAGILSEITADGAVVVGIGLNVAKLPTDVQPAPGGLAATSLEDEGAAELDRTELAVRLLVELAVLEGVWRKNGGDAVESGLLEEYQEHSATIGEHVRVELTGGVELLGTAQRIERDGTLVVRGADGADHGVSAGDVVHLRPA